MRSFIRSAAMAVPALVFSLCAGAEAAVPTSTITIENFSFKPATISVSAGTHLVFENHDDLPHSIVIQDLNQQSKILDTDETFETVLDKPGKYVFFCGIHPMMKGEITVTAP